MIDAFMMTLVLGCILFVIFTIFSLLKTIYLAKIEYRDEENKWRMAFRAAFNWLCEFVLTIISLL